jgi:small subunit ribosomal protein S1
VGELPKTAMGWLKIGLTTRRHTKLGWLKEWLHAADELEDNLEGLLHISELSDQKVENPQDVVKVDDEVDVKILRVDIDDRKIGLSLKRAQWGANDSTDYSEDVNAEGFENPSPKRGGMDDHGAMGTDKIEF